jgi:hypothetical protein
LAQLVPAIKAEKEKEAASRAAAASSSKGD